MQINDLMKFKALSNPFADQLPCQPNTQTFTVAAMQGLDPVEASELHNLMLLQQSITYLSMRRRAINTYGTIFTGMPLMTGQAFNLPGELDLPIAFRRMPGLFKDMETDSTCSYRIRTAVDVRSNVFVSDETLSAILCSKSSETGYSIHIRKVERVEGDEDCISIDWADNMTKNLQVADTARSNFQPAKQDLIAL